MATEQQIIEILVKLRDEAQAGLAKLTGGLGDVASSTEGAAGATDRLTSSQSGLQVSSVALGTVLGDLTTRVGRGLVEAFQSTVQQANQFDTAMLGLDAVARAMGISVTDARAAAQSLAADGLLTVQQAAEALKNVLIVGYGLPEATQLLNAHKDAAAFNRQGMLSLGDALVRVTEGLKFNNSQLTDSTGLGKNLSQIMKEAGLSQDAFGDAVHNAAARQAYLNDTLAEAAKFAGNAAAYADTNAGAQQRFSAAVEIAQQKIGHELQPALKDVLDILRPLVEATGNHAALVVHLGEVAAVTAGSMGLLAISTSASAKALGGLALNAASALKIFEGVKSFSEARIALQLLGESAGLTVAKLGLLGSAVTVAGTAVAGWNIGRAIDDVTHWSEGIQHAAERSFGFQTALHLLTGDVAAVREEIRLINLANERMRQTFGDTVAPITSAAEALSVLGGIAASLQEPEFFKKLRTDLPKPKNDLIEWFQKIQAAGGQVQASLDALDNEIQSVANAGGLPALRQAVEDGSLSVQKIADLFGISTDAVQRYRAQLKDAEQAQKAHQQAVEQHEAAVRKDRDTLASLGLLTLPEVKSRLDDLDRLTQQAKDDNLDYGTVLERLVIPKLKELEGQAIASGQGIDEIRARMKAANDELNRIHPLPPALTTSTLSVQDAISGLRVKTIDLNAAMGETAVQAAENTRAMQYFGLTSRQELIDTANEAVAQFDTLAASGTATPKQIQDAYKQMIDAVNAATGTIVDGTTQATEKEVTWDQVLGDLRGEFQSLAQTADGEMAEVTRVIGIAVDVSGQLYDAWQKLGSEDTKNKIAGVVGVIASGFQISHLAGGGALGGALGGAVSGAELGFKFGGGPIGGLIGAGIGAGIGFFTGSGPKTSPAEAFAEQFGGFDQLYQKLQQLGAAGRDMWRELSQGMATHDVDRQVAAIGRIQTAFEDLDAAQSAVDDKIKALQTAAEDFGGVVPDALQPVVEQLLHMSELTENQRDQLKALLGDPSFDGMKAAADRLGVSFEHMGQAFQQAQITQTAQGYARDLETLAKGGADMNGVLEDSKDKLIALADQAIATGATLPDTLKDYYQRLIDLGELTGPDGELVTNINQLTFAHIPDDKLGDIEGILESIRDILAQAIPQAVTTAQSALDGLHAPDVELPSWAQPPEGLQPGEGYWGVGPDGQFGYHTVGGAAEGIYARYPTLAVFGEGGEPELGGPVDFMSKALAGAINQVGLPMAGAQAIEVHVHANVTLDGQKIGEFAVKQTQKAARAGQILVPANAVVNKF
jgi:hypothetical protein